MKGTLMYKKMLFGVVLFGLFSVLFAACAIVDTANLNANIPAVHMGSASFLQSSVTIKKGDMLNLIDDSSSPHDITNGSWVGSTQHPAKEAGAPSITQNYSGSDSAPVGPFTNAGTFHIYCTIHPGMNLTVVVQ
jgi:plastocyanin